MSIFRDTFKSEIASSIEARQKAMRADNRTAKVIQYLNSRNAWMKMTSAVNVNGTADLAKAYVLSGGTLNPDGTFKSGVGSSSDKAYSTVTPAGTNNLNRLGIRPMPGITGVDIKSKSAYGSLREAVVSFQCWDIKQLEDLEVLYMRPGYTVLLEWGWTPYLLEVNGVLELFPNFSDFYSNDFLKTGPLNRTDLFKKLYDTSIKYGGNYDAMYGYIKNYNWSARMDGGYDCQTTIISTGEIIESLKVNYVRPDLVDFGMYDVNSVGQGYLNEIFTAGTYQTTELREFYEKNTLTGMWAELYKRLPPPPTPAPFQSTIPITWRGARFPYPGLKTTTTDVEFRIESQNEKTEYISLLTFVDLMNYYIVARSGDGNKEPLVELSVKANTYSSDGSILKCVAHPLQISTDPTICVIKSPVWETILTTTQAITNTPVAQTITANAKTIVDELVKASDFAYVIGIGPFKTNFRRTPATDEDAFLTAIQQITSANYGLIDTEFRTPSAGSSVTQAFPNDGLKGLIEREFKSEGNTQDSRKVLQSTLGFGGFTVDDEVVNIYYLYLIREHFISILGTPFDITLTDSKGSSVNLNNVLNPTGWKPKGNVDQDLADLGKILQDPSKKGTPFLYSAYKVASFALPPPTANQSSATTIINSTNAALANIQQLNKNIPDDYFYNGDPNTEIGVLSGIFLNVDYLYRLSLNAGLESQDGKEKNEINLYTYVKNVMRGVQTALGNVNNFELHVDPVDNKARIIDVNYAEPDKQKINNLFELKVQTLDSIVRSYNLESKIFPNQTAIVAIGSQAQGGELGIQNNTMIDWNTGLIDRTIPVKTFPPKTIADPLPNQKSQPNLASNLAVIIRLYDALTVSPVTGDSASATSVVNLSGRAKNSLRDLIVYFQSIVESPSANRNIIPTKFSFDMDGIGGLVIGHLFTINQDILPKGYKYIGTSAASTSTLAQTIVGIGHKLSNSDWVTSIDTNIMILDTKKSEFKNLDLTSIVQNAVNIAITGQGASGNLNGGGGGGGSVPTGGSGNAKPGTVTFINSPCAKKILDLGINYKVYNPKGNNQKRSLNDVTQIVLHNTCGHSSAEETICKMDKLIQGKTSSFYIGIHYAVDRGGGICRGIPLDYSCNHADNLYEHSVGIEIASLNKFTFKNGIWMSGEYPGKNYKADPVNQLYAPDLAKTNRPTGYGGQMADLQFYWHGYQYFEDYTDIQIAALREVIKEIVATCPKFRFNYQKGNYGEIYRNVFGMTNLTSNGNPKKGARYPNAGSVGANDPGVFVHDRSNGSHDDTFPSLKLINLLMEFGS